MPSKRSPISLYPGASIPKGLVANCYSKTRGQQANLVHLLIASNAKNYDRDWLIRDSIRDLAVFIGDLSAKLLHDDSLRLTVSRHTEGHQHGVGEAEQEEKKRGVYGYSLRYEQPCYDLKRCADAEPGGNGELVSNHLYSLRMEKEACQFEQRMLT